MQILNEIGFMIPQNEASEEKKLFFPSGAIKERKLVREGKLEGEYLSYFKSGKIKEKATYKNGNCLGKFLVFNEDGSQPSETDNDDNEGSGIWEEKDIANLLDNLKHFDEKQK